MSKRPKPWRACMAKGTATPQRNQQWQLHPHTLAAHRVTLPPFHIPPSPPSPAMDDLEDWELLGDDGSPTGGATPPQAPPVPVALELSAKKNPDGEFAMGPEETEVASPGIPAAPEGSPSPPPRAVFSKLGEVEFADMEEERGEVRYLPGQEGGKDKSSEAEEKGCWEGLGFGALCSMGVAAGAAICLVILRGRHQQQKRHQQNQKLHFQIRHDEKSMKQVVHQVTSLNQAISVVKAVPMSRAHLSFGGHYDVL